MPSIVQSSVGNTSGTGYRDMPGAIGEGHLLIVALGHRGTNQEPTFDGQGYTQIPQGDAVAFNGNPCSIWYKTAGASESTRLLMGNGSSQSANVAWIELDSDGALHDSDEAIGPDSPLQTTPVSPAVDTIDQDFCIAVCVEGTDGGWVNSSFTPPAGWTEIMDLNDTIDNPTSWAGWKVSSGGTEQASPVCTTAGWWAIQIASFSPPGAKSYGFIVG